MFKCILWGIILCALHLPAALAKSHPLGREKAELMGRVEDVFLHNFRDITWRKSVEWGDVTTDDDGLRSIQYTYEALIWDKDHLLLSGVFKFSPNGECVRVEKVEGYPQHVAPKQVDISTQQGLTVLVEDFFAKNYRDIFARKSLEWGPPGKDDRGNANIRYKYEATMRDKKKKIFDQVFTFDRQGKLVSVTEITP
jgi:hypothetical protein